MLSCAAERHAARCWRDVVRGYNKPKPPICCPPDGEERLATLEQKTERNYAERVELSLLRGHCRPSKEQEPRYYVVPSDYPHPGRWMVMDRQEGAGAGVVRGVRWYKESNAWLWADTMNAREKEQESELTR